jgi:hypothetical protein
VRLGDQIDGEADAFQSPRCAMVSGISVHVLSLRITPSCGRDRGAYSTSCFIISMDARYTRRWRFGRRQVSFLA